MKKSLIVLSTIMLIGLILYGGYCAFLKRTPERILKTSFNISLKDFDYSVESFDERWLPNGDGHVFIKYKFKELTQDNMDYLKSISLNPLPIPKDIRKLMEFDKIPIEYFDIDTGYYMYIPLSTRDLRDYKVFVINTRKNEAILYLQVM